MKKLITLPLTLLILASCTHQKNDQFFSSYFTAQEKLAHDQALKKSDIETLYEQASKLDESNLTEAIKRLNNLENIKEQREAFKEISTQSISLAKKKNFKKGYLAECPMAKARWIQKGEAVQNPYYGSKMFSCGSSKRL